MNIGSMLFDGWTGVARVVIVGTLAYLGLVVLLRASGKRTLSKMNAFDLVVTVALGSTLATITLANDIALVEGVAAFTLLILLQLTITWLSVRSSAVRALVKAEPTLLAHRGKLLHEAMRRERVTEDEALAAIRSQGIASLDAVEALVLETDGSFSTVERSGSADGSALRSVDSYAMERLASDVRTGR